jgi:hypothetical protein
MVCLNQYDQLKHSILFFLLLFSAVTVQELAERPILRISFLGSEVLGTLLLW